MVAKRGPLQKFQKEREKEKKMRDWNQLWSLVEVFSSGSLATSLRCASTVVSSVVAETGGHLGLTKN